MRGRGGAAVRRRGGAWVRRCAGTVQGGEKQAWSGEGSGRGAVPQAPFAAPLGIARALRRRRPSVLLSGGKHFHIAVSLGLAISGRRRLTRFGGRASNPAVHPHVGRVLNWSSIAALRLKYLSMDFVVPVNRELEAELHRLLGSAAPEVVTIANGVDVAAVRQRAAAPFDHPWLGDGNGPVIVGVGRLARQKGFDLLIKAVARLRRAGGHHRLIIAGSARRIRRAGVPGSARRGPG